MRNPTIKDTAMFQPIGKRNPDSAPIMPAINGNITYFILFFYFLLDR